MLPLLTGHGEESFDRLIQNERARLRPSRDGPRHLPKRFERFTLSEKTAQQELRPPAALKDNHENGLFKAYFERCAGERFERNLMLDSRLGQVPWQRTGMVTRSNEPRCARNSYKISKDLTAQTLTSCRTYTTDCPCHGNCITTPIFQLPVA